MGIVLSLVVVFILLLSRLGFLLARLDLSYKENVPVPSGALATHFNNGGLTERRPCIFVGVDIQGLMTISFLELNFEPFVQSAALQLQNVQ